MSDKEEINRLKKANSCLYAENQELKHIIHNIQAVNNAMRDDIEKECAAECGCIIIEGIRTNAMYQDLVGVFLANNYAVEIIPMDDNRRLKIIIKESEEK